MAGYIAEFFGYASSDNSKEALAVAARKNCPFLGSFCVKTLRNNVISGVCAIRQKTEGSPNVICCPIRLYDEDYKMLRLIAHKAFHKRLGLYAGRVAVEKAKEEGGAIAVFGKGWGGELRLLPSQPASINFIAYDAIDKQKDGKITPLGIVDEHCTTVYKVQEAFSSLNLPEGNVYKDAISRTLYPERYKD